jgi:hypothetical protein
VVGEEAKKNFSQYVVRKIGDENGFGCHGVRSGGSVV